MMLVLSRSVLRGRALALAILAFAVAILQDSQAADNVEFLPTAEPDATVVYKTVGSLKLKMFLFNPPNWKSTDRFPAIVFFFGGGWRGGDVRRLMPYARWLASQGMVAACVDYRVKSRHGVMPVQCVEDAKSAVRWMRANASILGIDPVRIVAAGDSAGGHLAAATATIAQFEAVGEDVAISSVPNALILLNPVLDAVAEEERDGRVGGIDIAKDISPNLHVRAGLPPTLIMHGTADKRVPISQAEVFVEKMTSVGNDAELWRAEEGGHSFWNTPKWRDAILMQMRTFLLKIGYLSPAPNPS